MIYRKGSLVEGITSDPGTIGEVVEKCVRNDTVVLPGYQGSVNT